MLLLKKISLICVLLLSSNLLTGCGTPEQQAAANSARVESEGAKSALKGLPENSVYGMSHAQVDQLARADVHVDNPIEMNMSKALESPGITPFDTAFFSYELARCQMYEGKLDESEKNFQKAITVGTAMNPQPKDLLQACYKSMAVLMTRQNKPEEAAKYDQLGKS